MSDHFDTLGGKTKQIFHFLNICNVIVLLQTFVEEITFRHFEFTSQLMSTILKNYLGNITTLMFSVMNELNEKRQYVSILYIAY